MLYVFTDMENVFFWSDDKKTLNNQWVALIGKKHWRFYQRRIDHNSHHDRNTLCTKGGKHKATKGVPRCYDIIKVAGGIEGGVFVKDYTLYKKWINEWYNNKNAMALLRAMKLHDTQCRSILRGAPPRRILLTHVYTALHFNRENTAGIGDT